MRIDMERHAVTGVLLFVYMAVVMVGSMDEGWDCGFL
jgi:hypothetical protein